MTVKFNESVEILNSGDHCQVSNVAYVEMSRSCDTAQSRRHVVGTTYRTRIVVVDTRQNAKHETIIIDINQWQTRRLDIYVVSHVLALSANRTWGRVAE